MSEKCFKLDFNGQAVIQEDFNQIGETAGLADDRVLAELLRLTPFDGTTVARGILPYRHRSNSAQTETVGGNGATGSVKVRPHRAVVGSRTTEASDAKANWRDIRSAIFTGGTVAIAANASGSPRWDLIYAAIAVDVDDSATTRKVKDPTSGFVTDQSVSTSKVTTVAVGVTAGTPAANPDWPATPADGGGTYYIPLAYVRVPNGFNATSTVGPRDIAMAATGLSSGGVRPASSVSKAGAYLNSARTENWGSSGTPPKPFLPPTMVGPIETVVVAVDFSEPSHGNGDIIDDSRDWRGRLVEYTALGPRISSAITHDFPWSNTGSGTSMVAAPGSVTGLGQTCTLGSGDTVMVCASCTDSVGGGNAQIYCDASTGYLKLAKSGTVSGKWLVWLKFSPVIENYRR